MSEWLAVGTRVRVSLLESGQRGPWEKAVITACDETPSMPYHVLFEEGIRSGLHFWCRAEEVRPRRIKSGSNGSVTGRLRRRVTELEQENAALKAICESGAPGLAPDPTRRMEIGDLVEVRDPGLGIKNWTPGRIAMDDGSAVPYKVAVAGFGAPWFEEHEVRPARTTHVPSMRPHDGKDDSGKAPWQLLPWEALADVVAVLAHGASKYGANTWQTVPDGQERYFGALMRHVTAWKFGEERDPDSGLPHLAHVATNALFLLALSKGAK